MGGRNIDLHPPTLAELIVRKLKPGNIGFCVSPHVHGTDRRTVTESSMKRSKRSAHNPHRGDCCMPVFLVTRLSL